VDDCVGEYDECGVCNGPGAVDDCGCVGFSICWDNSEVCDLNDCPVEPYFLVEINETGESTLFIFQDSISSLDVGDVVGLFDASGIIDADGNTGELLVGSGTWDGNQLEVVGISSVDLSDFGGPILPGSVSGNDMILKVWDSSDEVVYANLDYDIDAGSGTFNGLFTAISEVYLCEIPEGACDCEGNVLDECGVCGGLGAIYECGCEDIVAGACDCDGSVEDECGVCGGTGVDADGDGVCDDVDDCVGAYDECGICNGEGAIYDCGCEGYSVCWDDSEVCDLNECPLEPHFLVEINETGESTLFIFQDSISSLDVGDEVGIFDASGIPTSNTYI
jgi:hypothetical protein